MRYEGAIFRPPSEAKSLILQATIGCSHNKCTFCVSYMDKKYREREVEEVFADIEEAAGLVGRARRVFLADGNALAMDTGKLLQILNKLYENFPNLERVGAYAGPRDLLEKTEEELKRLREAGLKIVYLGVESGNDAILEWVKKGADSEAIIESGLRARRAGFLLSVTVVNGLGGREGMIRHAKDTAALLNRVDPEYVGLLTLMVCPGTPLARKVERNEFQVPDQMEILEEIRMMLEDMELSNCVFRSNHASNYLALAGTLPQDKEKLLAMLDRVLKGRERHLLRPERFRAL